MSLLLLRSRKLTCFAKPSVLRRISNLNRHHHSHRHLHYNLNTLRSQFKNLHHSHLKRFWKKYTLLISLSAIGITLSKQTNSKNVCAEEQIESKSEESDEDIQQLIEQIPLPSHSTIVWIWLYLRRFLFLVWNFSPVLMLAPFAYYNVFGVREYWLDLMHNSMANGGSTFIKLGQWISMRSDIFPIAICDRLSELRMRAPAHSFEETCQVIKDAFGKDLDEIFDRFYIEPTASGSIAQVHKAQICINRDESLNYFNDDMYKGNRSLFEWAYSTFISPQSRKDLKIAKPKYLDVAVKVRHPNILQNMYIDVSIMYILSNFVSSLPGMKGLKFPIHRGGFTQYLRSQIDLSSEGKSLQKMYGNFEQYQNEKGESKDVIFPKVIEELSNDAVLVETWEYGVPLCNLDLDKLTTECRHSIAKQCYDVFMKMALRDNFVHGDCHSGNILIRAEDVTDDGESDDSKRLMPLLKEMTSSNENKIIRDVTKRDIKGQLIFLDAGLTASLTPEGHKRFGIMMGHIATGKCDLAAEIFGTWAVKATDTQRSRFVNGLEHILQDSLRWRYKDKDGMPIANKGIPFISIGPLLRNVLILTQTEHITLDSSFSAVIASLGIIEGLIKTLDPSADFLQWGVPYLVKYRKLDSLRYLINGQ